MPFYLIQTILSIAFWVKLDFFDRIVWQDYVAEHSCDMLKLSQLHSVLNQSKNVCSVKLRNKITSSPVKCRNITHIFMHHVTKSANQSKVSQGCLLSTADFR